MGSSTWRCRAVLVTAVIGVGGGLVLASPAAAAMASDTSVSRAFTLVNQERAKAGCASLRIVSSLQGPAGRQSRDQAARNRMGHAGADGSTSRDRLGRLGYSQWAENIAQFQSAQAAVNFWMNSRPHRASMLNCAFTDTGLAVARSGAGRLYWTQTFGG